MMMYSPVMMTSRVYSDLDSDDAWLKEAARKAAGE
jgi:hypothetical protein